MDTLHVDQAERLFVADLHLDSFRVEQLELVEILQMVVAVGGRPDEEIGRLAGDPTTKSASPALCDRKSNRITLCFPA